MSQPIRIAARVAATVLAVSAVLTVLAAAAHAERPTRSYTFERIASLPQAAPGISGMFNASNFQVGGLNESAASFWATAISTGPTSPPVGEGLWITPRGGPDAIVAYSGSADPEGLIFADGFPGPVSINDSGDGAFAFRLLPAPGNSASNVLNAGVYRYHHATGKVTTIAKSCRPPYVDCGPFAGFNFGVHINSRGDVVFHGVTKTTYGTYKNPEDGLALYGVGIYQADRRNDVIPVVVPGDPAPSGDTFNNLRNAWQNERGDIAFGGHTDAEGEAACASLSCAESVYVRWANTDTIESIAHRGEQAPVPGAPVYFDYAFGPRINNRGDIVFVGCTTPSMAVSCGNSRGVYLYRDGAIVLLAYPGLAFQAEGADFTVERASNIVNNYYVNDAGTVVFTLRYLADANGDGISDSGVFAWDDGVYEVVARTGDEIPGVGTVAHATQPSNINTARAPTGYSLINNRGQVLFQVVLSDGTGSLLLATP